MTSPSLTSPSTTPVELRVRAEFGQLPVVRAVAETIAVLGDFTLDDVSDVKLAVDEVCSTLIKSARGGTDLICSFHVTESGIEVAVHAVTHTGDIPDERSFGWHVLRTLTDSISAAHEPGDEASEQRTTVTFVKSRGGDT